MAVERRSEMTARTESLCNKPMTSATRPGDANDEGAGMGVIADKLSRHQESESRSVMVPRRPAGGADNSWTATTPGGIEGIPVTLPAMGSTNRWTSCVSAAAEIIEWALIAKPFPVTAGAIGVSTTSEVRR